MFAARTDDGYLILGLTRGYVETLRGVPMLIESNDPRVRKRLMPETYDDAEAEAQWRRHATPELERLFLSRAQIVRRDLAAMRQIKDTDSWVLKVPDTHSNAWLASLNAARLALYLLSDLDASHLERGGARKATEKQREAVDRIHFLAELQSVLMGECEVLDDEDGEEFGDGGGFGLDGPAGMDGPATRDGKP